MNKWFGYGRLGKDPESIKGNNPGCRFSLATSESYKDKATGERKERVEWHNLTAWGTTATFILKHLKKGMLALVEGKITHSESDGKSYTNIVIDKITPVWSSAGKDKGTADQGKAPITESDGSARAGDDEIPF